MGKLFEEFKFIEEFTLWEDRIEHIEEWDKTGEIPPFRHVGEEWSIKTGGIFNMNIISKSYELNK